MIYHHPPFELLFDYVSGAADEGTALAVAAHAARCRICGTEVMRLEAVGGELLEKTEEQPVSEGLLAALLGRLDEPAPIRGIPRSLDAETRRLVPPLLRRYVGQNLSALPWRHVAGMFDEVRLPLSSDRIKASLMKLRPGCLIPPHTHLGHEVILVLDGGYREGDEHLGPGDFAVKNPGEVHQPIIDDESGCLALVVLDGPVKLVDAVGSFIDPFLII